MSNADIKKILGRVQKLIALAEHPNTPPGEAELARNTAERIMQEYRLAEEQLLAEDIGSVAEPIVAEIELATDLNPLRQQLWSVMVVIASHCDCRVYSEWKYNNDGGSFTLLARLVGFECDVRYAELLYTSARLVWSKRIDPNADRSLSDAENAYYLRASGMPRNRIASMLWGSDANDGGAHGLVSKLYRQECERRGEQATVSGRSLNANTYRKIFANEFVSELYRRLSHARKMASQNGALELSGRHQMVDEKFYSLYPNLRPSTEVVMSDNTPAQQKKPRKHKGWTKADEACYQRMHNSEAAFRGRAAGISAAREIEIAGSTRPGAVGNEVSVVDAEEISGREIGQ